MPDLPQNVFGQPADIADREEADQEAFYEATLASALQAEQRAGRHERQVQIAGVRIRLCFAGPRLEREFMPALSHIETGDGQTPDATIHIWDSASTGIAMVEPPCARDAFTDRGDIWGFNSTRIRTAFHWSESSVCVFDHACVTGVYWIGDADRLPYWARSSPMRTLFHWLLEPHGLQLVHAAAVGTEDGAVLITGKGGVGKSSTALSSLVTGLSYIGDDYLVVGLLPQPTVYALYCTAKLTPSQAARFPEFAPHIQGQHPRPDEKVVIPLNPAYAGQLAHGLPLRFVLTPRFGEQPQTGFEPVSALELHRAATFTTMSQLPHAGAQTHEFMRRLIDAVPSRRIVLGHDLLAVPGAIKQLLAGTIPAPDPRGAEPQVADLGLRSLVSVVIPVFNGARFLPEAIASVLAQNHPALEIIVIDDGSEDDIEAAVAALPCEVRFLRQPNAGPAAARNRGIRVASGEFLAFLDVDDLWPRDNLATMLAQIQADTAADVLLGRAQLARIDPAEPSGHRFVGNPGESYATYIGAGLYRAAAFRTNGLFDEALLFGEDTDWYTRARENGIVVRDLAQVTLIVRRHDANMTKGRSVIELNALKVFRKALERRRVGGRALVGSRSHDSDLRHVASLDSTPPSRDSA